MPRYTDYELATRLLNPKEGKEGIPAITSETDENGNVIIDNYLNRVLNIDKYKYLNDYLKKEIPPKEPSNFTILWENVKQAPSMVVEGLARGIDTGINQMMGVNENPSLEYISQKDYQDKKSQGLTSAQIWPHLTDKNNRTWGDWMAWSISPFPGTQLGMSKYDEAKTFFPEPSQRLEFREKFYAQGGEINTDGLWVDNKGEPSEVNKQWTPVEWNTREQYEDRKEKDTNWSKGVLKTIKQEFLYEWMDPATDSGLAWAREYRQDAINAPAFQELQKWSQSEDWSFALFKDPGTLTKKINNSIMAGFTSFGSGLAVGAITFAATRSPGFSATVSAGSMAMMDSSSMYEETLEYAIQQGFTEQEAHNLAEEYYNTYFLASMALERLPVSRLFRRTKKLKERKRLVKNLHSNVFRKGIASVRQTIQNFGPINRTKTRAILSQGFAEGITELSQLVTETALKSNYRDGGIQKNFPELFDFNEAMDSFVGGFGMGGVVGGFGGAAIEGTDDIGKPKTVTPKSNNLAINQNITTNKKSGVGSASPTDTDLKIPSDTSEYFEQIVNQDKNDTALNSVLVNMVKSQNAAETPLTKKFFKHQRSEYENYPIKKIADLVQDEGYGFIDKSNLPQNEKDAYKAQVAQELIRQKKEPLQNKDELSTFEQKQLDALNKIDINSAINAIEDKAFDKLINDSIDKKIEQDIDKKIESQISSGTSGGIVITPEMKAQAEAEGRLQQVGDTNKDQSYKVEKQQDGRVAITKGNNTVYKESNKLDQELTGPLLNKKIKRVGAYKNKDVAFLQDLKNRTEAILNSGLVSNKAKKIGEQRLKLIEKEIAKEPAVKPDAIPEDQGIDLSEGIPEGAKVENVDSITLDKDKGLKQEIDKEIEDSGQEDTKEDSGQESKPTQKELKAKRKAKAAKKKQKKNVIPQLKPISLGNESSSKLDSILGTAGVKNASELGREETAENLTEEQSDAIKDEVKNNEEKLKDLNCINKKG
jgi:hypothetical protein